jgi:rhamnosyltransferase
MRAGYSSHAFALLQRPLRAEAPEELTYSSVAAVVVLYYPQPFLLARLVESVLSQVDKLFVIDNTPSWDSRVPDALAHSSRKLSYRAIGYNAGLAAAQNEGIRRAIEDGHTHVLLLDQDSALPKGAVEGLLEAERSLIRSGTQVAAVGPLYVDEKCGARCFAVRQGLLRVRWRAIDCTEKEPVQTDYLIASGSLIRSSVLRRVGLMREELFIDWVDAEWSYRAQESGLSAYVIPTVVMRHSIGDATRKLLGRRIYLHGTARNYYIVRNAIYLLQNPTMNWRWRVTMLIYIPKYIVAHSWLANRRWESLRHMLRGVRDGITRQMRPFSAT